MKPIWSPYVLIMLAAAMICLFIAVYVWLYRRKNSETIPLILLLAGIAEWIAAALMGLVDQDLTHKIIWAKIEYIGVVSVPLAVLGYVLQHSGSNKKLNIKRLAWLAVIPVATLVLAWTNGNHGLIWARYIPYHENGLVLSDKTYGPGFWVYWVYSYLVLLAATVITFRITLGPAKIFRWQSILVMIGILAPWVGNLLYVLHLDPLKNIDLTPLGFSITGILLATGMFQWRLFDLKPITQAAVLKGMADGLLILDNQERIVEVNPAAQDILGLGVQELIGKQLEQVITNLLPPGELSHQKSEKTIEINLPNGKENRIYELSDSPFNEKNGTPGGRIIFLHDVTDRKQLEERLLETEQRLAEEALRESEDKFKYYFDHSTVGTSLTLPTGEINVNQVFCDMLGYSLPEFKNKKWQEITHPEDIELTQREVEQLLSGKRDSVRFIKRFIHKDGSVVWVDLSSSMRRDADGKPLHLMTSVIDITEGKQAEEALAQQNEALIKLNHFSIELSMLSLEEDLERLIARQIKEISGAEVSIFSEYNPANRTTTPHHIELNPGLLDKVVHLLGTQVKNIHSVVSDEMYREMTADIIGVRRTLSEAAFGAIPPQMGKAIQALLKVDRFIGTAYLIEGKLYGTTLLGMSKDQPDPPRIILENYIFLAASALRRKQAEEALKNKQRLLSETEKMGKVGGWEFDIVTQKQTWTEEVYHIHEVDITDNQTVDQGLNFYTPTSRPIIERAVQRAIEQGEPFDVELEIITAKGNLRMVHAIGKADLEHHRVFGFFQDITERKRAEQSLRLHTERVQVLLKLNQMTDVTHQELTDYALEEAVRITQSEIGYLAFLNDDETVLTMHSWSKQAMKECAILDKPIQYVVTETGLWGEAVRQRRPVITNDYAAPNPAKKGHPQGHVPVRRHMNVPVFAGQHIVLVAGVGNKEGEYDNSDAEQLTLLMEGMWRLIERKKAEEELHKSKDYLKEAQRIAHLGSWYLDVASNQVVWSEELYQMYGFDPALPPPPYTEHQKLFTTESWARLSTALPHTQDTGIPYELELELLRKDGSQGWMWVRGEAVLDTSGATVGLRGVALDITERKQAEEQIKRLNTELEQRVADRTVQFQTANRQLESELAERELTEEALRESEERFRRLSEAAFEAINIHDGGVLLDANEKYYAMFGFKPKELMGKQVMSLTIAPEAIEAVNKEIATGGVGPYESTGLRKDGTRFPMEIRVRGLEYKGRKVRMAAIMDITERKRAEQALQQRAAQLEAINKELEAFSYSVSHDLRAPLRGIDGWSLALLEDYGSQLDGQAKTYLERVRSEAQRMGQLIDDLLQLSRLTSTEMNPRKVNLSALAGTIADRLQKAQPERQVEFVLQPGLNANGDAHLLEIALTNLLDNAFKFTGKTPQARIEFGQTEVEGQRAFFVGDNGAGFDMALAKKLFGAFQRMHKASDFPGTGVGLTTVQRIVHRHGGRIWAEAAVDQGATFYFTLEEIL